MAAMRRPLPCVRPRPDCRRAAYQHHSRERISSDGSTYACFGAQDRTTSEGLPPERGRGFQQAERIAVWVEDPRFLNIGWNTGWNIAQNIAQPGFWREMD